MQIKGIKVEWTQTFEHHCIFLLQNFMMIDVYFVLCAVIYHQGIAFLVYCICDFDIRFHSLIYFLDD